MYIDKISLSKVPEVVATGITIEETATIYQDETLALIAKLTPADSNTVIHWTSSDESIATVSSSGNVTAIAPGTVTITATAGEVSDTCTVTVPGPRPIYGVIYEESFESFMDEDSVITEIYSVPGNTTWNGADHDAWTIYMSSGSVLLQPVMGNAYDDDVCLKMTPQNGGRMQIMYNLPADV